MRTSGIEGKLDLVQSHDISMDVDSDENLTSMTNVKICSDDG